MLLQNDKKLEMDVQDPCGAMYPASCDASQDINIKTDVVSDPISCDASRDISIKVEEVSDPISCDASQDINIKVEEVSDPISCDASQDINIKLRKSLTQYLVKQVRTSI
jgi:hypothetical protein